MPNLSLSEIMDRLRAVSEMRNSMILNNKPELLEFSKYMISQFQSIRDSIDDDTLFKKIDRMITSIGSKMNQVIDYFKLGQKEIDAKKELTSETGDCIKQLETELKNVTLQIGSQVTFIKDVLQSPKQSITEKVQGPDGFYSINKPPANWKIRITDMKTITEKNVPGLGDLVDETKKEILLFESGDKLSLFPIPGKTKIFGRIFPTATEIVSQIQIIIGPVEREQPPFFKSYDMRRNFLLNLSIAISLMDVNDIKIGSIGDRKFIICDFYQSVENVKLDNQVIENFTIHKVIIGLEGYVRDYIFVMDFPTFDIVTEFEKDYKILIDLLQSFELKTVNLEDARSSSRAVADNQFKEYVEWNKNDKFRSEFFIAKNRISQLNLENIDDIKLAVKIVSPFKDFVEAFDIEIEDEPFKREEFIRAIENADQGNYTDIVKIFGKMRSDASGDKHGISRLFNIFHRKKKT
jgi:hypothetical protein